MAESIHGFMSSARCSKYTVSVSVRVDNVPLIRQKALGEPQKASKLDNERVDGAQVMGSGTG